MDITDTIEPKDRSAWREWLSEHHQTRTEIWLLSNDRATETALTYLDAVEEAICFSWIEDILEVLKTQPTAWSNFVEFPGLYRRVRIGYIEEMRKNSTEFDCSNAHASRTATTKFCE